MEEILISVPKKDFQCMLLCLVWRFNMLVTHTVTVNYIIDMCCMDYTVKMLKYIRSRLR